MLFWYFGAVLISGVCARTVQVKWTKLRILSMHLCIFAATCRREISLTSHIDVKRVSIPVVGGWEFFIYAKTTFTSVVSGGDEGGGDVKRVPMSDSKDIFLA